MPDAETVSSVADPQADQPTPGERRGRRIALLSLLLLIPTAMAVVGWRDATELQRRLEVVAIEVPADQPVDHIGGRLALTSFDVLPPMAGIPSDRTFVRTRLDVEALAPGKDWLACRLTLVDAQGRRWGEFGFPPSALERQFRKPGEARGERCSALASDKLEAGTKLVVEAYFLVPTAAASDLRLTMSAMGGRPRYLRFAPERTK